MSTVSKVDESTLPSALQRGLQAVRERALPDALVVAIEDNHVIIAIGTMTKASTRIGDPTIGDADLPDAYVENQTGLFARVSRTYPNADSYGVITVPFLTRIDGKPIEWQHRNNANAASAMAALGRSDAGFWSWNWTGAPQRVPEDLVAVVEWARRCVREGAK
jgi:hypothetical protein